MKKTILTLALLSPALAFASSDNVTITPFTPTCGQQTLNITVQGQYGANNRHLVTYLDGVQIDHYNNEPASVTETVNVGVGTHQFKAKIYLIEWNATHFSVKLAEATQTFTVNACDVPPPPPVDVCPNLDGNQADVPEGYTLSEGVCNLDVVEEPPVDVPTTTPELPPIMVSNAPAVSGTGSGSSPATRLCFLSGGQICLPYTDDIEMIKAQLVLIDAYLAEIIKANTK